MLGLLIWAGLMIWVWKRGWRWAALLPFGICVAIGVIVRLANPFTRLEGNPTIGVFSLVAIIAMIVMGIKGKKLPVADEKPAAKKK
jgi:hypothetical protein